MLPQPLLCCCFLPQASSLFPGKGVEELLFLPPATRICETEEAVRRAAREGASGWERGDGRRAALLEKMGPPKCRCPHGRRGGDAGCRVGAG